MRRLISILAWFFKTIESLVLVEISSGGNTTAFRNVSGRRICSSSCRDKATVGVESRVKKKYFLKKSFLRTGDKIRSSGGA
jgi:hypothetical protein